MLETVQRTLAHRQGHQRVVPQIVLVVEILVPQ